MQSEIEATCIAACQESPVCCPQALPRWIVFNELVLTSKEYVRTVSEIKPGTPCCQTTLWCHVVSAHRPHIVHMKTMQYVITT